MATTKKALVLADELANELKLRQTALAVTQSYDTDNNPLVRLGAGTAGAKGALLKVAPISWPLSLDVLNLAAEVYTPHVISIVVEANYAATTDNVADINTWAELLLITGTALSRGTRVDVYQVANGTAPAASAITGTPTATFEADPKYGMVKSQ